MPSSHHQDETRLSSLVFVMSVVWTELATSHCQFEAVLTSLAIRWQLLKTVLTCSKFCSHHQQNCLVINNNISTHITYKTFNFVCSSWVFLHYSCMSIKHHFHYSALHRICSWHGFSMELCWTFFYHGNAWNLCNEPPTSCMVYYYRFHGFPLFC